MYAEVRPLWSQISVVVLFVASFFHKWVTTLGFDVIHGISELAGKH